LKGAGRPPAKRKSNERIDGWALFGRVLESLLKGSGALMAVVEHLSAPSIGGDGTFDGAWTPTRMQPAAAHFTSDSFSRAQPDLPHRPAAKRTDQDPRNVSDDRITRHLGPLAPVETATEPSRRSSPRSTLSRVMASCDTRTCNKLPDVDM
jgi:hypothetical protein